MEVLLWVLELPQISLITSLITHLLTMYFMSAQSEIMRISSAGLNVRGVIPRCLATSSNTYNGSITTEQTVSLTAVSGSLTINAGQIQIGSTIKVLAKFNTTNSTNVNINVRLKSGPTTIYNNVIVTKFYWKRGTYVQNLSNGFIGSW